MRRKSTVIRVPNALVPKVITMIERFRRRQKIKKWNKRANLDDIPTSLIWIFGLVLTVIIGLIVVNQFNTFFQAGTYDAVSKVAVQKFDDKLYVAWDWAILFLIVGFVAFSMLGARFIPSNPIFLFIALFYFIFVPFVSAIIGNLYDDMVLKNNWIAGFDTKMVITAYFMDHILIFSILYISIVAIVLYSRKGET